MRAHPRSHGPAATAAKYDDKASAAPILMEGYVRKKKQLQGRLGGTEHKKKKKKKDWMSSGTEQT